MTVKKKIPEDPVKLAKFWVGRYGAAMRQLAITQAKLHKLEKDYIVQSAKYESLTRLALKAGVKPGADVAAILAESD